MLRCETWLTRWRRGGAKFYATLPKEARAEFVRVKEDPQLSAKGRDGVLFYLDLWRPT
jgi:hypothetical protein